VKSGLRVKLGAAPDRPRVERLRVPVLLKKQGSNPRPGPSIAVRLVQPSRRGEVQFAVTIAPARTADEAAALAGQLRAGPAR
jgi:hypothetical protein